MPDTKDKIVELARPLIGEEIKEIVENYAKAANKGQKQTLQYIQEISDKILEEVTEQGKDLLQTTTDLQNLRTEFNAFRETVNKRDTHHQENLEQTVKNTTKEVVQNEVPKAVLEVVEPIKKKLIPIQRKGFFAKIRLLLPYGKRKT